MKTHTQGFVALFFVLGISSVLLTWVVLSSSSVFEYIYAKRDFDELYQKNISTITCADTYIDFVVRGFQVQDFDFARQLFYGDTVMCHIKNAHITRIATDEKILIFTSEDFLHMEVHIKNGFVVSL